MKEDLLNLNATVATVLDIGTWIWITSAVILTLFLAWLVITAGRHAYASIRDSFARAHQTIADIQQPREEKPS